jgi:hypothetical protein
MYYKFSYTEQINYKQIFQNKSKKDVIWEQNN